MSSGRIVGCLVAVVLAAGPVGPAAAQGRDTLTVGIGQQPPNLHPLVGIALAKNWIMATVLRPVTAIGPDRDPICVLCERLPDIADGTAEIVTGPDGEPASRATYSLREGLAWGDGRPVTTRDVLETWRIGRDPRSEFAGVDLFRDRIIDIRAVDERRFTVDRTPFECSYPILNVPLLPAHIEGPIYDADPATYAKRSAYETRTTEPGLYNGPFRIASLDRGNAIVLERNATWTGPAPGLRRIVIRGIDNLPALEANLLSGDIDYVAGEIGFSPEQVIDLERRFPRRFEYRHYPVTGLEQIDLNLDNPILADLRVRRALVLAIDREGWLAEVSGGRIAVAHGPLSSSDRFPDFDGPRHRFDPAAARRLLDEAGWRPGPGGIRVDGEGRRLALEISTTAGNAMRETAQQLFQAQWRDVGVEVTVRNVPARVFFGETLRERRFTGMALRAAISTPDTPNRAAFHSTRIPTAENGWSGVNVTGWRSERMDAVLDALRTTCEPGPRARLWAEYQTIFAEELPQIPLYHRVDPFVIPPGLTGIRPTGFGSGSALSIENWRWAAGR